MNKKGESEEVRERGKRKEEGGRVLGGGKYYGNIEMFQCFIFHQHCLDF